MNQWKVLLYYKFIIVAYTRSSDLYLLTSARLVVLTAFFVSNCKEQPICRWSALCIGRASHIYEYFMNWLVGLLLVMNVLHYLFGIHLLCIKLWHLLININVSALILCSLLVHLSLFFLLCGSWDKRQQEHITYIIFHQLCIFINQITINLHNS